MTVRVAERNAVAYEVVGVIGAGTMGCGVAQALAETGHRVVLVDTSEARLEAARHIVAKNLRQQLFFRRGESVAPPAEVLGRIEGTVDHAPLRDVPFVIENVTESWDIKRAVYASLDAVCPPATVFAVNTSAIPITRVAGLTGRAPQVLGMHFMNPVPLKPMVEVIRGFHTAPETLDAARALLEGMGKQCIVVEDSPGFVTNRVMMLTVNEAMFLVQEGVAPAEDVDRLFKTCFGHKMGPLETADLIGLDTVLYSLDVLYGSFDDCKYRPCTLLRKMVDAGLLGRKSGQGFYRYTLAPPTTRQIERRA